MKINKNHKQILSRGLITPYENKQISKTNPLPWFNYVENLLVCHRSLRSSRWLTNTLLSKSFHRYLLICAFHRYLWQCAFVYFFVSTLFPPKRGISPKRKRGITSTANNSWTGGYFGPGFVQGGRPGCPRFFDTPADPVGLLIEALDQILWKKIVKMVFVCVWGRPRGPWRLEEGGVSLLGTEEPSKQGLTQKKNFKPWERFPTKCRRYSPFACRRTASRRYSPLREKVYLRQYGSVFFYFFLG